MSQIHITLPQGIQNHSLQIGDDIYSGSFTSTPDSLNTPIYVGVLVGVSSNNSTLIIDNPQYTPAAGDFIMFSKNKSVNNTSLTGYFAEVKLSNNSTDKAELFAINSEIVPSSK
tara:strand:- start:51 stop:392 length:342 start_codon:yes stop_codon:yes gene_type:complete